MNKLYCAGTFEFDFLNSDYREKAKNDYRAKLLGNANLFLEKHDYIPLKENLQYIGPFYFESEGMIDETIVRLETTMIHECTHIIFLLDSACCPGTIAELILASYLNKHIEIFYIRRSDNEETESNLHSPCWFPIIMSKLINPHTQITCCKNYQDATKRIVDYVASLN